jgi:hypothetical protein
VKRQARNAVEDKRSGYHLPIVNAVVEYARQKADERNPEQCKTATVARTNLVAVDIGLERALNVKTEVFGLDGSELGQLDVDVLQMEQGDLLVEDLGKNIDTDIELAGLSELNVLGGEVGITALVQVDLGEDLVGEGAGHNERGVTGGTSKVDQTALGKKNDVVSGWEDITVNLRLDVGDVRAVGLEPGNVNLNIEVTNV